MPIGSAAVAGAGSLAQGLISGGAANTATQAAQQAATANNAAAASVYATNTANLQPYATAGQSATSALSGLLGTGGNAAQSQAAFNNYLNSTNYQFQLGQGEQSINTANAPSFNSGATAKALDTYSQGLAGSALSGYEGLLQGQSGQGVQAASSLGSLGTQYASQTASNNNNAAGVTGSAAVYGANAANNSLTGGLTALGLAGPTSSYGSSNALSSLFGGSSGATAPTTTGLVGTLPTFQGY